MCNACIHISLDNDLLWIVTWTARGGGHNLWIFFYKFLVCHSPLTPEGDDAQVDLVGFEHNLQPKKEPKREKANLGALLVTPCAPIDVKRPSRSPFVVRFGINPSGKKNFGSKPCQPLRDRLDQERVGAALLKFCRGVVTFTRCLA